MSQIGRKMLAPHHPQHGSLDVGVRHHNRGSIAHTVDGFDPFDAITFNQNSFNGRIEHHRATTGGKGARHGLGQHAAAPFGVLGTTGVHHRMPPKKITGADFVGRRPRLSSQPRQRSPHRLGFKGFGDELAVRTKQPPHSFESAGNMTHLGLRHRHFAHQPHHTRGIQKDVENRFVEWSPIGHEFAVGFGIFG